MPQQFLLNLHVSPVGMQQSRIRVTERVPTDSTNAGLLGSRTKVIPHSLVRPPWLAGEGTHEDPARFQQLIGHFLPMPTENVHEVRVQRQPRFRAFGFYCLHSTVDPGPLNLHSQTFPVEVFPAQTEQLACSKSEAYVHHGHCPGVFIEMRPETLKFLNRQSARLLHSLGEPFE